MGVPNSIRGVISQVHATIYRGRDHNLYVKDGGTSPSMNGLFVAGRRIYDEPVELREGAEIYLLPRQDGWALYLSCPVESEIDLSDPRATPTLGFENEVLRTQLDRCDRKIESLNNITEELSSRLSLYEQQTLSLRDALGKQGRLLQQQHRANQDQDRRLRSLRLVLILLAILGFVGGWMALGGDAESLEMIEKAILLVITLVSAFAGLSGGPLDALAGGRKKD